MKKLGLILIAVALCVSLITSCAPENEIDEIVDMKFDVSKLETRTLNQSVEKFNSNDLYWMYEATKADGTSYTVGQTEGKTVLGKGTSAKLTLSAGTWEFKLYGYKDANHSKLAYEGETKATISGENATVAISVKTLQTTNGEGKLVVSNAVLNSVKDANVKLTISLILDNDAEHSQPWEKNAKGEYENKSFTVKSGRHSGTIIVKTSDDKVVYSNEGIDFDIYDNLTTTIGGLLDGKTTQVEITTSIAEGINKTESTTTVEDGKSISVKASSAVSVSGKGDTEVEFSAGTLSPEKGNATVTITTYDTVAVQKEESKPKFTIENENSVIGGLELLVKQNGEVISTFTNPVTVKTYIGEGLTKERISVFYDKQDGTNEKVENFEYDATTGILSFVTSHFSRYYILISNDYIAVGKSGKYYTELPKAIEEEITFLPQDKVIDLSENNYNISGIIFPESDKEYTVTIKNGNITGSNRVAAFTQYANSHLILDKVNVNYKAQAVVFLYQGSNPAWLEVKNSALTNNVYGIGTNASKGTDYVYITIDNSKVTTTSSDQDNTAILFNVPGKLEIKNDSVISGERQGLIVRGGEATISNSTIISSGSSISYADYSDSDWKTGNEVPLAALVIGNRSNAYKYPTTVTLDNVKLSTPNEESERKLMYVYQNEGAPEVTVRGTLNGLYDAEAKENKRIFFNDATSIKSLGLFNLAANRSNTEGKTVTIALGDEVFSDINYSQNSTGYTKKGLLIGNTSLNSYNAKQDEGKELNLIIEGGSITSSSTGYQSIDGLADTSVYMLLPNINTNVTFKNVVFNGVFSFDVQIYTGPWSSLKSISFIESTFNGIIVGYSPADENTFYRCTFNKYINKTYANNSNPIWWRANRGSWDEGGKQATSLKKFIFVENEVESTRPVKIERIGMAMDVLKFIPEIKILDNKFDISSQSSDTVTKNMAINIGQNDGDSYYHLYDDGNTISSNTASLYTAALGSGSNQWLAVPGTKIMDRNGNEKTIIARVWKTTTGETFEMKSIEK